MSNTRRVVRLSWLLVFALACRPDSATRAGSAAGALRLPVENDRTQAVQVAAGASSSAALSAEGNYSFLIPADFNNGIFGFDIENRVSFVARKSATGEVTGHYSYDQMALGESFIFSGTVTCMAVYDTPVLQWFPGIPAMTQNRVKWGGIIEQSNDPTLPPGGFIWFQSIDNTVPETNYPDLSTLSGFGDEAANEAFCASSNVPNPAFGPHALRKGVLIVR